MTTKATIDSISRPRRSLSLRNRFLIAFILLAFFPVLLTGIVSGLINADGSRTAAFNQMSAIARLKAGQIDEWLSSLHTSLALILTDKSTLQNTAIVIKDPSNNAIKTELRNKFNELNKTAGYFEELFIMDANGKIILSTNADQEGKNMKNQSYFSEGIKKDYISPPFYDLTFTKYSVIFSQPIQDQNGIFGVIAGRANLTVLNHIMTERNYLGETGETYLIGANYVLLSDLRFTKSKIGGIYIRTQGATNAITSQSGGTALYSNYSGISVLGAYYWIPKLQIILIAETGESEALLTSSQAFATNIALMIVIVLIATVTAFIVTGTIVKPISELVKVAENISAGNLEVHAQMQRDDEIGALATAFNTMTSRLRELIGTLEQRVADRTAVAESARVEAESARKEAETQVWFTRGQVQLAEKMRGEQNTEMLANNIISHLCQYLDAQTGALFLVNGDRLKLTGRYAYMKHADQKNEFGFTENLVGEVAKTNRTIHITDIGDDAPIIRSALGNTKPKQLLIVPIGVASTQAFGVVELATLNGFSTQHEVFLQRNAESIAIAFQTAQTRERIATVLLNSQQLAEELQAQEEELRSANDELRAQAENITGKQ